MFREERWQRRLRRRTSQTRSWRESWLSLRCSRTLPSRVIVASVVAFPASGHVKNAVAKVFCSVRTVLLRFDLAERACKKLLSGNGGTRSEVEGRGTRSVSEARLKSWGRRGWTSDEVAE